jgi:hypothetical protein
LALGGQMIGTLCVIGRFFCATRRTVAGDLSVNSPAISADPLRYLLI